VELQLTLIVAESLMFSFSLYFFVFSLICCVRGSPRYLESAQAVLVLFIKWDEMLF
jgi:hypothetical protein